MKAHVENHGSLALFTPDDVEAREWIQETAPEDAMFWGRWSMVVEPRYVAGVIEAFYEAGGELCRATQTG